MEARDWCDFFFYCTRVRNKKFASGTIHFQILLMWQEMNQGKCETHVLIYCSLLYVMSVNMCLIYRCFSSASAVIRSWFVCELQKSTAISVFKELTLHFLLRKSHLWYPPCPQNSIIVNPPSPSEILKAVRRMVWIFSGIAQWPLAFNLQFFHLVNEVPSVARPKTKITFKFKISGLS